MRDHVIVAVSLIAFCTGSGASLRAETVLVDASKDNTLYEDASGAISNGAGGNFFAGRTGPTGGSSIRRGLVAFDFTGKIPAGASITDVQLTLHMSRTASGSQSLSLHRLVGDWGEGSSADAGPGGQGVSATTNDATWLHRFFPDIPWATPGGDFLATSSATLAVAGIGFYTWSGAGLVADVQAWIDGTASNFGWLLLGEESVAKTAKRFDSRENAAPMSRPVLQVSFVGTAVTRSTWGAVKSLYRQP